MKILVVGAGIAGLAVTLAFRSRNIACDVVERESVLSTQGAGMYLPGNAVRALDRLGMLPRVREVAAPIDRQRIFNSSGKLINEIDLKSFWQACGGCLSLSRAALQGVLGDMVGEGIVRSGTALDRIQQDGACVNVTFSDGSTETYDLVIGADGIRSTVRNLAFGAVASRDLGIACWRTIVHDRAGLSGWTAMLGAKRTLLAIPIEASKLYVYGDVTAREGEYDDVAPIDVLRRLFSGFAEPLRSVADTLDDALPIHTARLREIPTQIRHKGGVVLIGDAANATSPSMAQGAGMALEDALVLAEALAETASVPAALDAFSARRLARVQWVQNQSRKRDKVRTLPGFVRDPVLFRFGTPLYAKAFTPLIDTP